MHGLAEANAKLKLTMLGTQTIYAVYQPDAKGLANGLTPTYTSLTVTVDPATKTKKGHGKAKDVLAAFRVLLPACRPSRTAGLGPPSVSSWPDLRQQPLAVADPEQRARHLALIVALKRKPGIRVRQHEFGGRDGLHDQGPRPLPLSKSGAPRAG